MGGEDPDWGAFLQAAFLAVLEAADEGLIVFDGEGRCRMIGRRAGELFGIEPASHVGKPRDAVLAAFAKACEEPESFIETVGASTRPDVESKAACRTTSSVNDAMPGASGISVRPLSVSAQSPQSR